ncbi:uncharacterized protein LOC21387981 isoform X1 [Morus notabilis]|uniref:uncharacterized protein LOC21387981 isoform X1 n=1 Tax=Morus notabilis TaxID=981085 RepID=UPI000CED03FE|nr:uncharacterized protein LOC21387981 isoform X1 [Morus notabilis]
MDDEAAVKVKKVTNTIIFQATPIRVSVSLLAIFLLMWIIRTGFGVVTEAEMETRSSNWGFHFGVVTLLFGILFVALGLPILTNLFLKLSEQLQKHDETSIYPGGGEMKPIHTIVGRILVTLITMVMLAWASYTGYRLATEPRRDDKYYPLIFPIGIVTIVFGSVYIIIGLGLIADLALALTVQLLLRKKKGVIAHQDPNTEAKSFV